MLGIITGLFSLLGSGLSGFFGLKEKQVDAMQSSLKVLGDVNASASQREQAIASVIMAEANSGSWLTRSWRPLMILVFGGIVIAHFFGFTAPNVLDPVPAHSPLADLFEIIKVALVGYIPARTIDKAFEQFTRSRNLQKLLETYLKR